MLRFCISYPITLPVSLKADTGRWSRRQVHDAEDRKKSSVCECVCVSPGALVPECTRLCKSDINIRLLGVFLPHSPPCVLRQGFSIKPEFTCSDQLGGQWTPEILLSLLPQSGNCRHVLSCLGFYVGTRWVKLRSSCMHGSNVGTEQSPWP